MHWQAEPNGWVAHPIIGELPDGTPMVMPWNEAPLNGPYTLSLWGRLRHRCRPWSIGVHGWFAEMQVTERCWCGGTREGHTIGMRHAWAGPYSREVLTYDYDTGWYGRLSRYFGTAVFHRPTLRTEEA